jgi:hypothetical protein
MSYPKSSYEIRLDEVVAKVLAEVGGKIDDHIELHGKETVEYRMGKDKKAWKDFAKDAKKLIKLEINSKKE